ncbi:FecCD family ABC transporter permease [Pseudarthrobacter sp. So.54]
MVPTRTALLALAAAGLFAACVLLGSYTVTVPDFLRILAAHVTGGEKIPGASFIVMEHKLPRALVGTLIGAAFGLSGALFQTMLRNPLASPDVIGISYGASAAAVTAMVVFGASGAAVAGAAFAGALGVAGLIYSISRSGSFGSGGSRGDAADSRLILAGVGIAAALHAVVSFLLTRADIRSAADILIWLNGSLNSATWDRAGVLGLALTALVPAVLVLAGPLRILELGDDTAAGLGVRVGAVRLGIVVTAVGLAAAATAAAGPVSFVAFLAGPIARRFVRKSSLPASAFAGVVIVLGADYIAANSAPLLLDGTVLPVGVVTGALGAPFLLWQLLTSHRKDT